MAATDFIKEELQDLRNRNLYKTLRVVNGPTGSRISVDGKSLINLAGNNYLGLANHPKVVKAMLEATQKYGAGSGSVRQLAGTFEIHQLLEKKLAEFKHAEASLAFTSGIAANSGVIPALISGPEDVIISDELNHASIIDGVRLTKAQREIFSHKDMGKLRELLQKHKDAKRKLIITDGVFSMDGDVAPLREIVELAKEFGAMTYVDDSHGEGVLGRNGRGIVDHFNLHGQVDVEMGTLSKGFGVIGGFAAGSQDLRDYLIQKARTWLFTTSHPPGVAAACIAALEVVDEEPQLVKNLWDNTNYFKKGLQQLGFDTGDSETPITPVITGSSKSAQDLSKALMENGVFALPIVYPMVAENRARIRTIVMATHTKEDLNTALSAFEESAKSLNIL